MIEAVNSVIASAQVDRSAPAQVDAARAYAANPERVQEAAPVAQAPYVSPYIHIDVNYDKAVLQIRNPDTGDVLKQFPSETVLEARLRAEASRETKVRAPVSTDVREAPQAQQTVSFRELTHVQAPAPDVPAPSAKPETQVAVAALVAASQTSGAAPAGVSVTA